MYPFEWDETKNNVNLIKHGIDFYEAQDAFFDPHRVIAHDPAHSKAEPRFFCYGQVKGGIVSVRFTYRDGRIRIIGAGFWRKGKQIYEEQNN